LAQAKPDLSGLGATSVDILFESFLIDQKGCPEYMTGDEKMSGGLDP
jgi:hypothetical protein